MAEGHRHMAARCKNVFFCVVVVGEFLGLRTVFLNTAKAQLFCVTTVASLSISFYFCLLLHSVFPVVLLFRTPPIPILRDRCSTVNHRNKRLATGRILLFLHSRNVQDLGLCAF